MKNAECQPVAVTWNFEAWSLDTLTRDLYCSKTTRLFLRSAEIFAKIRRNRTERPFLLLELEILEKKQGDIKWFHLRLQHLFILPLLKLPSNYRGLRTQTWKPHLLCWSI